MLFESKVGGSSAHQNSVVSTNLSHSEQETSLGTPAGVVLSRHFRRINEQNERKAAEPHKRVAIEVVDAGTSQEGSVDKKASQTIQTLPYHSCHQCICYNQHNDNYHTHKHHYYHDPAPRRPRIAEARRVGLAYANDNDDDMSYGSSRAL